MVLDVARKKKKKKLAAGEMQLEFAFAFVRVNILIFLRKFGCSKVTVKPRLALSYVYLPPASAMLSDTFWISTFLWASGALLIFVLGSAIPTAR